ncbi:MAG: glycosyltransferase family 39 protein [Vicinamibacterales bacterium]
MASSLRLPSWLLAASLIALYAAPLVIDAPLLDPDEGLHAAIAREMVERGDWVTPRFNGRPFLDKPVLFFWVEACAIRVLGANEIGVRLPGLLFGLLGALTAGVLARRAFGAHAARWTWLVASSAAVPLAVAQAAVHDVALVPWTTLALAGYWRLRHDRPAAAQRWRLVLGVGIALGLALLTKGLSGVALVGVAYAGYLIVTRQLGVAALVEGLASLCLAALVAAPWYGLMERRNPGYLRYYFFDRHVLGYATSTQLHGDAPWWYYLPVVLGGSLPWLWLIWPSVARAARVVLRAWRSEGNETADLGVAFAWTVLVADVVFLSAAGSKLVTYAMPVFPATALLAGEALARTSARVATTDGRRADGVDRMPRLLVAVLASAVALPLAVPAGALYGFGIDVTHAVWFAGAVAATIGAYAWRTWRRDARRALSCVVVTVVASLALTVALGFGDVARASSARALAQHFGRLGRLPARLFLFEERVGSFVFYLPPPLRVGLSSDRIVTVDLGDLRGLARTLSDDEVVAVPAKELGRLARTLSVDTPSRVVVDRFVLFPARDLLRFRPPGDRRQ